MARSGTPRGRRPTARPAVAVPAPPLRRAQTPPPDRGAPARPPAGPTAARGPPALARGHARERAGPPASTPRTAGRTPDRPGQTSPAPRSPGSRISTARTCQARAVRNRSASAAAPAGARSGGTNSITGDWARSHVGVRGAKATTAGRTSLSATGAAEHGDAGCRRGSGARPLVRRPGARRCRARPSCGRPARQHVAAELVGAEQVHPGRRLERRTDEGGRRVRRDERCTHGHQQVHQQHGHGRHPGHRPGHRPAPVLVRGSTRWMTVSATALVTTQATAPTMARACTTGRSRCWTASTARLPRPG